MSGTSRDSSMNGVGARRNEEIGSFKIFLNIITAVLGHVIHVPARKRVSITVLVWHQDPLHRRRFPSNGCRVSRRNVPSNGLRRRRLPSNGCFVEFVFTLAFLPSRNRRGRRRTLGKRPSFAQFWLQLQKGTERRNGALEPSGITAEETLRGGGRIEIDALLEIFPKSANVLLWGSKLKIVYVHHQQGFGPGVPEDTGPIRNWFPAASKHSLLAVFTPDIPSQWVSVEIQNQWAYRILASFVMPLFWPTVLG